jgi:hypothetical protein
MYNMSKYLSIWEINIYFTKYEAVKRKGIREMVGTGPEQMPSPSPRTAF